jgi:hypothetical protein
VCLRQRPRQSCQFAGVALAAGVIAVLDGLSLFQSVNKKGKGSDEESGHKTDGDEVK